MSELLARWARTLSSRWIRGLLGAIAILAVLIGLSTLGGEPAPDDFSIPGTDSQVVADLLEAHSPAQAGVDSQVVFRAKTGKIADAANRAAVEKALAKIGKLKGVNAAPSPFAAGGQSVSRDGTIAFTTVQYTTAPDDIEKKDGTDLIAAAELANGPTVEASVRGALAEYAAEQEVPVGEFIGIALAGVLLFVLFRSFASMGATILAALLGVMFAQVLLMAVSKPLGLPEFAAFLAGLLGLGAGIDYALLVIGRYREQIALGYSSRDAAAKAAATSGSAVVTAGLIVMVAIAGLLAIGIPVIGKMGVGAAVGVAGVVISAVTLLFVLIGAFARWLRPKEAAHVAASPAFTRWGQIVTARPWLSIAAGVLILLVFAAPATHMRLGQPDDGNKPVGNTSRIAYDNISKGFGPGINGPFLVVADIEKGAASNEAKLEAIGAAITKTPGVLPTPVQPQVSQDGEIATMVAFPATSPQDERTSDLLGRLRDEVVPAATRGTGLKVYIGGQTAAVEDLSAKTAAGLPVFIVAVIGLSVLLLMMAFRSLWIPLVSAVFNLLSVAAAYGIVTAVFQDDIGGSLIGAGGGDIPVVFYVPVMLFAILFGLSMDYNVFLLSRIHEAHNEGDAPREAVVHGMGRIGKVILFAGLIMTSVFISFTFAPDVGQKMIGIGLGLAILIDVLIVRLVIAPAVVLLLGSRAWWLPRWLDKVLPNVALEGHLVEEVDPKGPAIGEPGYVLPGNKAHKAAKARTAERDADPVG